MEDPSFIADIARAGLALVLVIGLMFGLAMLMRRLDNARIGNRHGSESQVHTLRTLDSRRRLVEVHWRGEIILVMTGPEADIVLARRIAEGNNKIHDPKSI